jgi:hypothetical protein
LDPPADLSKPNLVIVLAFLGWGSDTAIVHESVN